MLQASSNRVAQYKYCTQSSLRAEQLEGIFEQTVGGHSGGDGGNGGDGGGGGYEHTRQPEKATMLSEDHWIVPWPKMTLSGPLFPEKLINVPDGWLGMRRKS